MGDVPSGTVTFLFTDIEDSSRMWDQHPVQMRADLERHDDILNTSIAASGGYVFTTAGDSFAAAFRTADSARRAAVEIQSAIEAEPWGPSTPIRVRLGLHTGEAHERDGDYFGQAVNVAARIMSAGHGGQILVSEVSAGLFGDSGLVDLGEHRLKGVSRLTRLFQVGDIVFRPLRTGSRTVRLPSMLSALVGRDELLSALVDRLADARLVTLIGPGGVGKTRLAIAAAERLAEHRDLTVFADLAAASDGSEVLAIVARALEVTTPTVRSLSLALAERRAMLVMDNCEHVIDDAADLVLELLEVSPSLSVLATSREGLAVEGEQLVAVPGLDTRSTDAAAVTLFAERARAVETTFELSADNENDVRQLCTQLDGIPLAIELAAARVGVMSPRELVERLSARLDVLGGGRRRRSRDRHQTLRDTIDWSHDLLTSDEASMFAQLAVFAGSFDLAAAVVVNPGLSDFEVVDVLSGLVDKSLLSLDRRGEASRFRFLETIRTYAEEKLISHGNRDEIVGLLTVHLSSQVRDAVDGVWTGDKTAVERISIEIPNMRRCLDAAVEAGDIDAAAGLISPLVEIVQLFHRGTAHWTDEILTLPETQGHTARQAMLVMHGMDLFLDGDFRSLRQFAEESLSVESTGENVQWWTFFVIAILRQVGGDHMGAVRSLSDAVLAADDAGEHIELYCRLASHWTRTVQPTPPHPLDDLLEEDLAIAQSHPSELIRGFSYVVGSIRARAAGNFEAMLERAGHATKNLIEGSGVWFESLQIRAWAYLNLGEFDRAVETADLAIDHAHRHGDPSAMIFPVGVLASVLRAVEDAEAAALVRAWLPPRFTVLLIEELAELDRWLPTQLSVDDLAVLTAEGRNFSVAELQAITHTSLAAHREQ